MYVVCCVRVLCVINVFLCNTLGTVSVTESISRVYLLLKAGILRTLSCVFRNTIWNPFLGTIIYIWFLRNTVSNSATPPENGNVDSEDYCFCCWSSLERIALGNRKLNHVTRPWPDVISLYWLLPKKSTCPTDLGVTGLLGSNTSFPQSRKMTIHRREQ